MSKRVKRAVKFLVLSAAGLGIISAVLFLWFARSPTTQLIDASGNALTAEGDLGGGREDVGGSLFREARALIKGKAFAAAKENLLQVVEASDRDGEACILLCDVSLELKEVDAAADYGLKAVELLPDSAAAHLSYAKALGAQIFSDMQGLTGMLSAMTRLGHFKEVVDRVIELDPEDTEARTMLVFYNMAPKPLGDIDRAIELCREIELRDPVTGKQLLAACYSRKKESERAIALLLGGIEEYPEEHGFRVALADIYGEQKRFDAADTEYEAARRGEKDQAYYRSLYAQARMRIVNEFEPARAVELLDEFIRDEPDGENLPSVAHALWRKGNALEQLEQKPAARESYEESLRLDPTLALARKSINDLGE